MAVHCWTVESLWSTSYEEAMKKSTGDSKVIFSPVLGFGNVSLCACNRRVLGDSLPTEDFPIVPCLSPANHAIVESPYNESPTIPLPISAQCSRSWCVRPVMECSSKINPSLSKSWCTFQYVLHSLPPSAKGIACHLILSAHDGANAISIVSSRTEYWWNGGQCFTWAKYVFWTNSLSPHAQQRYDAASWFLATTMMPDVLFWFHM